MKVENIEVDLSKIRNIGFIAHIDAGKTTVTERVLYFAGEVHKIGNIDEGTTVMDFMDLERERGITIGSAATTLKWNGYHINVIDTPGHVDFTAEVERSLRVLDGGVVILESVSGVQPQSETVWRQADKYNVPRIIFINKMDRLGANFEKAVDSVIKKLGANPVPIQIPIGSEANFSGVVDLVKMVAYTYEKADAVVHVTKDIPEEYLEIAKESRSFMIEKIAECDDFIMEAYLGEREITEQELKQAIRRTTIARKIYPVMAGSALKHRGINPLLDAIIEYLPAPGDKKTIEAKKMENGEEIETFLLPEVAAEPVALAFKITSDKHVGKLVYLRIYSGKLESGISIYNVNNRSRERIGRLLRMHADGREEIHTAYAGEIIAAIGLKNTKSGHTLCEGKHQVILESIKFPEPVLSVSIEPAKKSDQDKMIDALTKMVEEDPSLNLRVDSESGQTLLSGMGELHLSIITERCKREFKVDVVSGKPQVSYRETINTIAEAEGKYVRQSGGRGQFGVCTLRLEPLVKFEGIEFESEITGSVLPTEWFGPIERGFREAANAGTILGYPVVGVKAFLTDGSHHEVDSSEVAFKIAARIAFKEAMKKAKPKLLEPIMKLVVIAPVDFLGDVLGDLNSRRASVMSMNQDGNAQTINATIPLSETFRYATRLRSMTTGRGVFTMEFSNYEKVPDQVLEEIKGELNK